MSKEDDDYAGGPVGEHNRGGRGNSKSNNRDGSEVTGRKPPVTMEEVKKWTKGRDKE